MLWSENPYTLHVSTTQITFTNAFKEEFWRRYQDKDTPRTIMYDLGYDPEVLGRSLLKAETCPPRPSYGRCSTG